MALYCKHILTKGKNKGTYCGRKAIVDTAYCSLHKDLSKENCDDWKSNPNENPVTRRQIKRSGSVSKKVEKQCSTVVRTSSQKKSSPKRRRKSITKSVSPKRRRRRPVKEIVVATPIKSPTKRRRKRRSIINSTPPLVTKSPKKRRRRSKSPKQRVSAVKSPMRRNRKPCIEATVINPPKTVSKPVINSPNVIDPKILNDKKFWSLFQLPNNTYKIVTVNPALKTFELQSPQDLHLLDYRNSEISLNDYNAIKSGNRPLVTVSEDPFSVAYRIAKDANMVAQGNTFKMNEDNSDPKLFLTQLKREMKKL